MTIQETLEALGYEGSANFLQGDRVEWSSLSDYGHIFRKAALECGLHGVYALRPSPDALESLVPVVYVCEAADEVAATRIHRLVWNQNVVPFLLVQTPRALRLYNGFRYQQRTAARAADPLACGVLETAASFNELADRLAAFRADSIDQGFLWKSWGKHVTPETRVDWRLLKNLQEVDRALRDSGRSPETSHALIGKFVYLSYLRHRQILSDGKLADWGIDPECLFSRNATLEGFWRVNACLDEWLNGAVFPFASDSRSVIDERHLRLVAGVFAGDSASGQLHLDFQAYDFSFIPIETLSVIYEQFLHTPENEGDEPRGRAVGAYYTPVPLVNFMLDELDAKCRLKQGMTVLDPACGSGAFLVQCYRRLIERNLAERKGNRLRPRELRELLTNHIFGVDQDPDACRVAELSLVLTLLDYVEPPDLSRSPQFRLPILRDRNIFRADFFDSNSDWSRSASNLAFDWVIGNPPWIELSSATAPQENPHAWRWIQDNANRLPVGGNQLAEAFAWKAMSHLGSEGVIGLLLPAMTLFKDESRTFRQRFFGQAEVWCVANFANLAYVLFAGRAQRPAAAFFYQRPADSPAARSILTYAPFVMNQEANLPDRPRRQKQTWSIILNSAEVREISRREAASGSMLPWKLAMWGSYRDARLLERTRGRYPEFGVFAGRNEILAHEGIQLRHSSAAAKTRVEFVPELVGKKRVDFSRLRNCGRIFSFPRDALEVIQEDQAYLRLRGGRAGIEVSRPPHIVLDAARRFAIYCDEFILVPARQVGIAGPEAKEDLLRALSVYLSSDFAVYHQFLSCPEWGISTNRATLDGLRNLPIPLEDLSAPDLNEWAGLQQKLAAACWARDSASLGGGEDVRYDDLAELVAELNERVFDLLGLRKTERTLVTDLVNTRMEMVHGKVTSAASSRPSPEEMQEYLAVLVGELDNFVENQQGLGHTARVIYDANSAMVVVELGAGKTRRLRTPTMEADESTAEEFSAVRENLRQRHSQWLYFDRSLRIYEGPRTYLFKPLQRIHWTKTQALLDAGEVIAENLAAAEAEPR